MSLERILGTLLFLSGSAVVVAVALSGGGLTLGSTAATATQSPTGFGRLIADFVPTSGSGSFLAGLLLGWVLHWFYALPWGDVPRAIANWLLGWRRSVGMFGLAMACIAVLMLY
jgi:hypothetical protein